MKRRIKRVAGQAELFAGARKPAVQKTAERSFAEKLNMAKLIPKTTKRKNPVGKQAKTINVLKEVEAACTALIQARGVNLNSLFTVVKQNPGMLNLAFVLRSGAVASITRSPIEQSNMIEALKVIINFTNDGKRKKNYAKRHMQSPQDLLEKIQQKSHMSDIAGE